MIDSELFEFIGLLHIVIPDILGLTLNPLEIVCWGMDDIKKVCIILSISLPNEGKSFCIKSFLLIFMVQYIPKPMLMALYLYPRPTPASYNIQLQGVKLKIA